MSVEGGHEGGCACGAVRYRVEGEPILVNNCHCRLCQRQTGSTSVVNAFYETERLTVMEGELTDHTVPAGGPHVIRRCRSCGVAVWSHYPRLGRLGAGVRVGTLDQPGDFRPDAVIFTESAMPWTVFPGDIPVFETVYDHTQLLPPERAQRLTALIERRKAGEG